MARKYNIGEIGPKVAMELSEGTLTFAEVNTARGTEIGASFQTPSRKGDIVEIAGDMTVKKSPQSSTNPPLGVVVSEPQFQGKEPQGSLGETLIEGNYKPRIATIELFGKAVRTMKLVSSNAAVTAGDYLVFAGGNQKLNKATDSAVKSTSMIALQSAPASSGAEIPVLLGYYIMKDTDTTQ